MKYILYSNINSNLKKLNIKINIEKIKKIKNENKLIIQKLEENYPAILTYTSGTTGKPKIAVRSHEFLEKQGEILKNTINYEDEDIEISTMPIFTLSNINAGITTVIADTNFSNLGKTEAKKIVNQIIREKVNRIMSAPKFLELICDYCIKNDIKLNSVKKVFTGGGAVFVDFIEKLKKIFENAKIITIYGSTEAEPISKLDISDMSQEDIYKIENGYGILAGNVCGVNKCKIIKTGIKEIGEISEKEFEKMQVVLGEIVVSGDNVLKGYLNGIGDKENKFSVENVKYHRTGDLGFFDEERQIMA